jgi:hypothetical protein
MMRGDKQMKKLMSILVLAVMLIVPAAFAEDMGSMPMGNAKEQQGEPSNMTVYQCSMDGYTSDKPGNCPKCGMKLNEKTMTASQAKAALEQSQNPVKQESTQASDQGMGGMQHTGDNDENTGSGHGHMGHMGM